MDQDGGGWTVLIRRKDIEPREDFYRDWSSYKWGFGYLEEEFYWGNEYIWMLTSQLDRRYQVHFWLRDWYGLEQYAVYENFAIEAEDGHYRLHIGDYSGNAGDSFSYHNNYPFSTYDRDYDSASGNCAEGHESAWWYYACSQCQLTGKYYDGGYTEAWYLGITWYAWKSSDPYSLKAAVMKIRPSDKA